MKKLTRILFAVFVLLIISQFSFAHDPPQQKKEKHPFPHSDCFCTWLPIFRTLYCSD